MWTPVAATLIIGAFIIVVILSIIFAIIESIFDAIKIPKPVKIAIYVILCICLWNYGCSSSNTNKAPKLTAYERLSTDERIAYDLVEFGINGFEDKSYVDVSSASLYTFNDKEIFHGEIYISDKEGRYDSDYYYIDSKGKVIILKRGEPWPEELEIVFYNKNGKEKYNYRYMDRNNLSRINAACKEAYSKNKRK